MLREISQAVRDKYHMISLMSRTSSTKQTRKQNRTRGVETRNRLVENRRWGREIRQERWGRD